MTARPLLGEQDDAGCAFLADDLAPHVDFTPLSPQTDLADLDGCVTSDGRAAERLAADHPLLPVGETGRLGDSEVREHFVEGIFAGARLREFLASDWRPGDLVVFHSRHKLQILAHDPVRYRETGRIVAQAGTRPRAELAADYRQVFLAAFASKAGRGRHVNALQHVLGPLSPRLDDARRTEIVEAIEDYRLGRAPLRAPAELLLRYSEAENHTYLADQTYLDPFPAELPLRNHL